MKRWKNALAAAFDAPLPMRREEFLRPAAPGRPSAMAFLILQAGYIRKRVFAAAGACLLLTAIGASRFPGEVVWLISGAAPLFALLLVAESGRSAACRMAELETATCFSLRSVVFARMSIILLTDLALLLAFLMLGGQAVPAGVFAAGLYVAVPFLLTANAGFFMARRCRGPQGLAGCAAAAAAVSVSVFVFKEIRPQLWHENTLCLWMLAAAAFLMGTGRDCILTLAHSEDWAWS